MEAINYHYSYHMLRQSLIRLPPHTEKRVIPTTVQSGMWALRVRALLLADITTARARAVGKSPAGIDTLPSELTQEPSEELIMVFGSVQHFSMVLRESPSSTEAGNHHKSTSHPAARMLQQLHQELRKYS